MGSMDVHLLLEVRKQLDFQCMCLCNSMFAALSLYKIPTYSIRHETYMLHVVSPVCNGDICHAA